MKNTRVLFWKRNIQTTGEGRFRDASVIHRASLHLQVCGLWPPLVVLQQHCTTFSSSVGGGGGGGADRGPWRRAGLGASGWRPTPVSPGARWGQEATSGVGCGAWTAGSGGATRGWLVPFRLLGPQCLYGLIAGSEPRRGSECWPLQPTGGGRWTRFCKDQDRED